MDLLSQALKNMGVNPSTQTKGDNINPPTNQYQSNPWEQNASVAHITGVFNSEVPTIEDVLTASMMLSTPSALAIKHGAKYGGEFGQILQDLKATRQKNQNELQAILLDQQKIEFEKQKLQYQQNKNALTILQAQAKQGNKAVGETFRQVMNILPKLDSASADRLMQNIVDDPIAVDQIPDEVEAAKWMTRILADSDLTFKEKSTGKGKVGSAVPKIRSTQNVKQADGSYKQVQTYTDGTINVVPIEGVTGRVPGQKKDEKPAINFGFGGEDDTSSNVSLMPGVPDYKSSSNARLTGVDKVVSSIPPDTLANKAGRSFNNILSWFNSGGSSYAAKDRPMKSKWENQFKVGKKEVIIDMPK
jgi:hypothetical protein